MFPRIGQVLLASSKTQITSSCDRILNEFPKPSALKHVFVDCDACPGRSLHCFWWSLWRFETLSEANLISTNHLINEESVVKTPRRHARAHARDSSTYFKTYGIPETDKF